MSKRIPAKTNTVEFRQFWEFIAAQLGDAWLSLNPAATALNNFIALSYDPKNYLREVIHRSYESSRCQNLNCPICLDDLLDILGETAYQLRAQERDDLFDIELLEEIAWHLTDRYSHCLDIPTEPCNHSPVPIVVSFPNYRIRKANTLL